MDDAQLFLTLKDSHYFHSLAGEMHVCATHLRQLCNDFAVARSFASQENKEEFENELENLIEMLTITLKGLKDDTSAAVVD